MTNKIIDKLKHLCELHNMPMPDTQIQSNSAWFEGEAETIYNLEYDKPTIRISYNPTLITGTWINEAIAHEFAHYMTKEIGALQALLVPEMPNSAMPEKLFRQSAEKIAERLEHIFMKELEIYDQELQTQ